MIDPDNARGSEPGEANEPGQVAGSPAGLVRRVLIRGSSSAGESWAKQEVCPEVVACAEVPGLQPEQDTPAYTETRFSCLSFPKQSQSIGPGGLSQQEGHLITHEVCVWGEGGAERPASALLSSFRGHKPHGCVCPPTFRQLDT